MNTNTPIPNEARQVMHECSQGSLDGSLTFPEVLARLATIGCEDYSVDLRRREKTYYLSTDVCHTEALPLPLKAPGREFAAADIVADLRAVQRGEMNYPTFLERITEAGCVGYIVYVTGRRARYLGRNGESYVEVMPSDGNRRGEPARS